MEEVLEESGLSKNEAIVYLKLSEIGISSAYRIAKDSELFKANTYDALKRLVDKGLVSKKVIENKVLYEASDPSFLIDLLDVKREKINEIIPSIRLLQKSVKTETEINVYKGADTHINLLFNLFRYNEPILVYGAPKQAYQIMKHRITKFHKERIKKKIKMYHIYNFDAIERIRVLSKMPLTPVRRLPQLFDSQVSTVICGNEVIFSLWQPFLKTIQIKDKDMAKAYKNYFKILWKNAKKVNSFKITTPK